MSDLRLADEVMSAAKYISMHEETDVEVLSADGSRTLYVRGEEVAPVWLAAPMPQIQPGQSPSDLDLTPKEVRLGRWHNEAEQFIPGNSFSVPQFLDFYRLSLHSGQRTRA